MPTEIAPPYYASRASSSGTGNVSIGTALTGCVDLKTVVTYDGEPAADRIITYMAKSGKNREWGTAIVTVAGMFTSRVAIQTIIEGVPNRDSPANIELTDGAEIHWIDVENQFDYVAALADSQTERDAIAALLVAVTTDAQTASDKAAEATNDAAIAATKAAEATQSVLDVAAIQQAIADINAAINPKIPYINLLKDAGRWAGEDQDSMLISIGAFTDDANQITPYNGALGPVSAGKFITNNTTHGGTAGALTQTVDDLLTAMGRSGSQSRHGAEFYVAEWTAGNAQLATPVLTDHYILTTTTPRRVLAGPNSYMSYALWVRVISGSAAVVIRGDTWLDGLPIVTNTQILPVDGWKHVAGTTIDIRGYFSTGLPHIFAQPGSVIQMALPVYVTGRSQLPIHTQPVLTLG